MHKHHAVHVYLCSRFVRSWWWGQWEEGVGRGGPCNPTCFVYLPGSRLAAIAVAEGLFTSHASPVSSRIRIM